MNIYEEDQLEEEQPEETYHTWDEANYNGFTQSDFI